MYIRVTERNIDREIIVNLDKVITINPTDNNHASLLLQDCSLKVEESVDEIYHRISCCKSKPIVFLNLTSVDGSRLMINMHSIESMRSDGCDSSKKTIIYTIGAPTQSFYSVKETPEKICRIITEWEKNATA